MPERSRLFVALTMLLLASMVLAAANVENRSLVDLPWEKF